MMEKVNALTNTQEVIKITSSDNKIFYVNKDVVCVSKTLRTSLEMPMAEGAAQQLSLNITSEILEVCIKYMHYQTIYRDLPVKDRAQFKIDPIIADSVLKAAIYLEC